jgi:drug/metabolite transporter (DMT)-like permease
MTARAWTGIAALGIVWGIPYVFIKIAVVELSPWDIAWGRVTIGALILGTVAGWRRVLRTLAEHRVAICAFGLTECAIPYTTIAIGERWIPSSVVGVFNGAVPLMVALISGFFGIRERARVTGVFGMMLGYIGICILARLQVVSTPLGTVGVGYVTVAMVCYAIAPLIVERHLPAVNPVECAAGCLIVSSLVLIVPAAFTLPKRLPGTPALTSVLVLGALCSAGGMVLMTRLVGSLGAYRTSIATYVNPLVATLLGVWMLHERLGIENASGLGLILIGLWLTMHRTGQDNPGERRHRIEVFEA